MSKTTQQDFPIDFVLLWVDDSDPEWRLTAESEEETYFDLAFTFRRYKRIAGGKKHMKQIS